MTILCMGISLSACGPDVPEECGRNVERVVSLDFSGASTISETGDNNFEGYDVTATIVRTHSDSAARVCYAVRDEDPARKLFWAVDDVLDAGQLYFPPRQDTRTFEGNLVLEARDGEVCGSGSLPEPFKVRGCSGEREAEVYIHPYGSSGPSSPIHKITVQ